VADKELTPAQQIAELQALLKKANEESAAKDNIIATQDEQLAAANAQGAGALSVVIHEKKRYQVLAGQFSIDDKVITHTELKTNAELVAKLVKEESPLLLLLEEPKSDK
jgi:hypothetical protein